MDLPKKALSIQQPWAFLIVHGYKDIENRDWRTNFRGATLVHAGKALDKDAFEDLKRHRHPVTGEPFKIGREALASILDQRGGIVGAVDIITCVDHHTSPWFVGRHGFVLRNGRHLPFMPMKGQLGFFAAEYVQPAEGTS